MVKGKRDFMAVLRAMIWARGMTNTDIATRLGVTKQCVGQMLRKDMRVSTLQRICDALDCEVLIVPKEGWKNEG